MNRKILLEDLSDMGYKEAWNYQTNLLKEIIDIKINNRKNNLKNRTKNHFLFVEHPHVYTIGRNGNLNNLLLSEKELHQRGVGFYRTNRGGDITYHGPGQIVGYPILDLENFFTDIHKYLRLLEEVVILTISEYGLKGNRIKKETGVWLDVGSSFTRKICAIGVRSSRWVTMHGFALNINVDLKYFDSIIPCGIKGKAVTSLEAELNQKVDVNEVKKILLKYFKILFDVEEIIVNS